MADVKIKSISKTDHPATIEQAKSDYTVWAGFKFGFGIFLAFLTGVTILAVLTASIWYGMLAIR